MPSIQGGAGSHTHMEAFGMTWMILKDAPNAREAFEFIRFMLSKENAERRVDEAISPSPRKDVDWPELMADGQQMFQNATLTFQPFDGMNSRHPEFWTTVFSDKHQEMFVGQVSPEEFIETLQVETKRYWESR